MLTINAAVHSPEQFDEFWLEKPAWGAKRNPFLPKKFGVLPDGEGGEDFKIVGEEGKGKSWKEGTAVYELRVSLNGCGTEWCGMGRSGRFENEALHKKGADF